jgi:hypothetical protein
MKSYLWYKLNRVETVEMNYKGKVSAFNFSPDVPGQSSELFPQCRCIKQLCRGCNDIFAE